MLDLKTETIAREVSLHTRTTRHRFAFAGVAFEILAGEGVAWELPLSMDPQLSAVSDAPVIADVVCSVAVDRTRVQAPVSIQLVASGAQRYAATASIAPTPDAAAALVRAIAAEVRVGHDGARDDGQAG